ncbi:hypothetical protein K1T71_011604 [Dendrolimus kikuchii]|uniref:Uncharacterized protein n=1 Tax=Dendrolimus kikuchii TaxID=765133 RepID=A0ACC1CLT0_9NEOP|nr:hypothetical protein K1T71_011604 [Dendrolimus kikuchii]
MALPDYNQLIKNTLLSACIRDNITIQEKRKKIETMIIEGADVNFKDANDNKNTALHIAVSLEAIEIVSLLLYRGAQVLNENADGITPLDLAKNINSDVGKEIEAALVAKLKFQKDLEVHKEIKAKTQSLDKYSLDKEYKKLVEKNTTINQATQYSYNKRSGTSGVTGQLYETKILSLVMLKASTDEDIQHFYLGTNINGIGAFDDLCFRYKLNDYDKDILVLLQAKHRDDPESRKLTINDIRNISGDFGLPKYLDSYLKIKAKFNNKNDDPMFAGDFSDVECSCILYTPSKDMLDDSFKSFKEQSCKVNELLNTYIDEGRMMNIKSNHIFQFKYSDVDIEFLTKFMIEEKIKNLGVTLMDFVVNNGKFSNMLTDELIRTYHVVLAQKVIDVSSKAPSGMFRNGRFRPDFFYTYERYVTILRESCYRELVTTHAKTLKLRKKETKKLLQQMKDSPCGSTLSKLFGTVLTHNEKLNKLELIEENMKSFKQEDVTQFKEYLKDIQFNESILNEAIETICKDELVKKEFKLPNSFGNFDMTIRSGGSKDNKKDENSDSGSKKCKTKKNNENAVANILKDKEQQNQTLEVKNKIENKSSTEESKINMNDKKDKFNQRLDHLASKFEILFKRFQQTKVIEIDDNIVGHEKLLEEGFLDINGGIGGAVGNLLVMDNDSGFLQFEACCTADTASKFFEKLKRKLPDKIQLENQETDRSENVVSESEYEENLQHGKEEITSYKLNIKTAAFPRLSFLANINDKLIIKQFLDSLWFYTTQGKEDKVESILKKEIDRRYHVGRGENLFRIHSDAIFLRFHDEIQKWWMSFGQVPYLTNERKIFDEINKYVIENPLLTILNVMYLNKLKKVGVEYNVKCVKNLQLESCSKKIINVVTEMNILSGIKLMQYFNDSNYIFIDFDYVLSLPKIDFDKMLSELKLTKINTLIVVYETTNKKYGINENLTHIINIFKPIAGNKVIVITNNILAKEIQLRYPNEYVAVNDEYISLCDLTNKSQTKVFQEARIIFQGEKLDLSCIINNDNKHLVKPKILWKLINNEKIEIGRKIYVSTYYDNENDNVGSTRTLKLNDTYDVDSLFDIEENVVVITSKPAMGKSTLLKYLALETKKDSPEIWIPIINFSECSDSFCRWLDKKIEITFQEKFKLLCKVVLKNDVVSHVNFEVENEENKVKIKSVRKIDPVVLFEIELFIEFYNNRKIIFLFDDFDDVCPPYEKEVLALLNTIEINNRLWITSRCYPVPKTVLERKFGRSYTLMPLNADGQINFLTKFFKTNINLEKLNNEQFSNVSVFLKYISKKLDIQNSERQIIPLVSIPLHFIYILAVEFFKSEINYINSTIVRETLKERWDFDMNAWGGTLSSLADENSIQMDEVVELAGTPLYLYIAANYFQFQMNESIKLIVDRDQIINKWDIVTNAVQLYKNFLEDTLRGVCLKKTIANEDVKESDQVQLRHDFLEKHKKLLLYAVCKDDDLNKLLRKEEINEMKETIARIQNGEERSGSIECVMDDVPKFFHLMFAEYFIIEVLVDILKAVAHGEMIDFRKHKAVWDFLINILLFNCPPEIRKVFNYKLKHDPELRELSCQDYCRDIVFELLLKQNDPSQPSTSSGSSRYTLKMAISDGLTYLTEFLIACIKDKLNKGNIHEFVDMIKNSNFMEASLGPANKVFVNMILDIIKEVDPEKIFEIMTSTAFVDVPVHLASLTGDENVVENVRTQLTLARDQLTASTAQIFGISRDTTNLLTGIFRVVMEELRK